MENFHSNQGSKYSRECKQQAQVGHKERQVTVVLSSKRKQSKIKVRPIKTLRCNHLGHCQHQAISPPPRPTRPQARPLQSHPNNTVLRARHQHPEAASLKRTKRRTTATWQLLWREEQHIRGPNKHSQQRQCYLQRELETWHLHSSHTAYVQVTAITYKANTLRIGHMLALRNEQLILRTVLTHQSWVGIALF